MPESRHLTFQTRLALSPEQALALEAYAALFGRAERSLFAALQAAGDRDANALKRDFQREFGLTARQYNAIRVGLEGRIASIKERRPELLAEGGQRIARAKKVIARIKADLRDPAAALKAGRRVTPLSPVDRQEVIAKAESKLHQKKRRLAILEARHGRLALDHQHGIIRLCFGSKRLFRAQFALQANGYADHGEWLAAWRAARSAQLLVLGSKDETGGCQGCVAGVAQDDSLTLRLRLPDALIQLHGKYIVIPDVRFAYGQERILAALQSQRMLSATKSGRIAAKRVGSPISYRFLRDEKGWRLFASVEAKAPERVSSTLAGAIGIDINADHLAVTRVDRFGNWADSLRFETPSHGKSEKQVEALLGEAAKEIAGLAATFGVPVVHEKLDFRRRKAEIEGADPRAARMLSSFAYSKALAMLDAACHRAGVEVIEINPAYTSVIGAVNHAQPLGIGVHQAAAMAIARRGLGLSETPRRTNKDAGDVFVKNLPRTVVSG